MKINKPKIDSDVKTERCIISLMLRYKEIIRNMLDHHIDPNMFCEDHSILVESIYDSYTSSSAKNLLTAYAYREWLKQKNMINKIHKYLDIYDACFSIKNININDIEILKSKFLDSYTQRKGADYARMFKEDIDKIGHFEATKKYVKRLESIIFSSTKNDLDFSFLDDSKEEYINKLIYSKNNPDNIIRCNIPEIDEVVSAGFVSQHLTLVVGDVGSGKTNLMLNIALNIYDKHKSNVMFVPLEMRKSDLINRIVANRADIDLSHLTKPQFLSDKEEEIIKKSNIWNKMKNRFAIIDAKEQTTVDVIESEIEKRLYTFKPDILIIDYIANLRPHREYRNRNDLEVGSILKKLRFMGNKYGFHILSAAQMGRSMIKQLREGGSNATPDSTGIRGSHEYSADSDSILCLIKVPGQSDTVKVFALKSRHGRAGQTFELRVDHSFARVSSTSGVGILSGADDSFDEFEKDMNTDIKKIIDKQSKINSDVFNDIDFSFADLD